MGSLSGTRTIAAERTVERAGPMTAARWKGKVLETSGGSALDPNQTPDAEDPMKGLVADDPVRVVRTIIQEIDDQAVDQVFDKGLGRVGVGDRVKVFGGFELLHG